ALRLDLRGRPTVAELLGRVKERTLEGQSHQDLPFEQVVEIIQPPRSMSHSPLFQVMFTWQNVPEGGLELPGLKLSPIESEHVTSQFDLLLSVGEESDRIVGGLEHTTALFERETVERYLGYWRQLLAGMVVNEEQEVDRLPLLRVAESWQVVEEWNATEAEYESERCIHELFEEQVKRTPEAVAVVFEDASVTYADL